MQSIPVGSKRDTGLLRHHRQIQRRRRQFHEVKIALCPSAAGVNDSHRVRARGELARESLKQFRWGPKEYQQFVERLGLDLHVHEAESGFFPPPVPQVATVV